MPSRQPEAPTQAAARHMHATFLEAGRPAAQLSLPVGQHRGGDGDEEGAGLAAACRLRLAHQVARQRDDLARRRSYI